jgi:hypothetical protein
MGIAVGLPSLILGVFFGVYTLVKADIIGWAAALVILLVLIFNALFWMVKLGVVGKNRQ